MVARVLVVLACAASALASVAPAWRAELLRAACAGTGTCLNCTLPAAEAACAAGLGCVAVFDLNYQPPAACEGAGNLTAVSDYALCSAVLGPTGGAPLCFFCRFARMAICLFRVRSCAYQNARVLQGPRV